MTQESAGCRERTRRCVSVDPREIGRSREVVTKRELGAERLRDGLGFGIWNFRFQISDQKNSDLRIRISDLGE